MGRPTREQAALSAMLAEQRDLEIKKTRKEMCLRWRACPAIAMRHLDFRKVCDECTGVVCALMREKGLDDDGLPLPPKDRPFCGARARSGDPCKNKVIPGKRRCKYHGGLSTGPKTDAGKAKIAAAQVSRWQRWREES